MAIAFRKVNEPYGWMGNMSPYPIEYEGKHYHTAEHLFQVLRLPEDHLGCEDIRMEKSPMSAKMKAKKYKQFFITIPRSQEDCENMALVVALKLEQHPELIENLLATGSEYIVEDTTNRGAKFWGAVRVNRDRWEGKNMLGHIWMLWRDLYNEERNNA